jgi:hypothetical protein
MEMRLERAIEVCLTERVKMDRALWAGHVRSSCRRAVLSLR